MIHITPYAGTQPKYTETPVGVIDTHTAAWLLASLAIQPVELATPMFTQVIIDKIIARHSESMLIVPWVARVVFMLFTSGMSWLRQYLIILQTYRPARASTRC